MVYCVAECMFSAKGHALHGTDVFGDHSHLVHARIRGLGMQTMDAHCRYLCFGCKFHTLCLPIKLAKMSLANPKGIYSSATYFSTRFMQSAIGTLSGKASTLHADDGDVIKASPSPSSPKDVLSTTRTRSTGPLS